MAPTDTPKKPFHVAVCGGGIGGLCMTIGLLHQNISCKVYEAAPGFAEIGAGVSFGPNSLRAMSLIDPDIMKGYEKRATRNAWPEKQPNWFDFQVGVKENGWKAFVGNAPAKEGEKVAEVKAGNIGQSSVHRAHFLDELVKLVPDEVAEFGKRVEKVDKRGEKMLLTFQDGSTAEADAVIGCDGVKARTRQIVLGEDHPATHAEFSGVYAYRGLIPMEKAVAAVGDELARNSQMYLGHNGHLLTFPIEKGATMNVVAFQKKADGRWDNSQWVLPMKKEDMFKDFEGWGDNVQQILSLMEKPDVWALFDHPPAPTYFKGRLALLGDAAHASTPHQGAGAGQAIEDAFILSRLLGDISCVAEIEGAFKAYDAIRRPRSQKVVTTSRDACAIYQFRHEELGSDMENIKTRLETRYNWIWDEDLQQQLAEARAIMTDRSRI
ncbi:mannitol 1-phosphate dehydrogenase [Phlyctema vagabunda]|uniref:Mannitol 1-phosphate dehydrogenase n=1 Tax=Phlyctema vagabunda TaxID=108571 RepID=A0ABR4P6P7_9HELO